MRPFSGTVGWSDLATALARGAEVSAKAVKKMVRVVDSHTAGESTRVVVAGAPELGVGTVRERQATMVRDFDDFRSMLVNEPRGSQATVGVVLGAPHHPEALLQLIYFNNVGYLAMCVHATIGAVHTLAQTVGFPEGPHRIETPAGLVQVTLEGDGSVSVENVTSYRFAGSVSVKTERHGVIVGDVAYGGNWFFITPDPEDRIGRDELDRLRSFGWDVRRSLERAGVTGRDRAEVDHVYLTARPSSADLDQRNFVLCPGGAYDRSPCGTGTSANVAGLAEDGRLREGETWNQESCIGSRFTARFRREPGDHVVPTINGRAHLTGEANLVLEGDDPFPRGLV